MLVRSNIDLRKALRGRKFSAEKSLYESADKTKINMGSMELRRQLRVKGGHTYVLAMFIYFILNVSSITPVRRIRDEKVINILKFSIRAS